VESATPKGTTVLVREGGVSIEVKSPVPLPLGAKITVMPQPSGKLALVSKPVSLSAPLQSPEASTVLKLVSDLATEMGITSRNEKQVPLGLVSIAERAQAITERRPILPSDQMNLIRSMLYLFKQGVEPAKITHALSFPGNRDSFSEGVGEVVRQILGAVQKQIPNLASLIFSEASAAQKPIFTPQSPGVEGRVPFVPLVKLNLNALFAEARGFSQKPGWVLPALEIVRQFLDISLPSGKETVDSEAVSKTHRQGGLFLENLLHKAAQSGGPTVLPQDLKAGLFRLLEMVPQMNLSDEGSARLTGETNRMISMLDAMQVRNLADNEFHHLFIPMVDEKGETTAYVSIQRRKKRKKIDPKNTSLTLRITLSALGELESRVEIKKGYLWITFFVESDKIRSQFEGSWDDLRAAVKRVGYQVAKLKAQTVKGAGGREAAPAKKKSQKGDSQLDITV